jgi:two-component SAPR family response regulator
MQVQDVFPTIMLIDDNRIDNILNKKVLEKEQIASQILVFNHASQAMLHLKNIEPGSTDEKRIPAIIFIDVVMPEMNGFEFIREFNTLPAELKNQIKIVFISSSHLTNEQKTELSQYDISISVVAKPLNKSVLSQFLKKKQ